MNKHQENSYIYILIKLVKSTSFWSLISGVTGVFAFLLGGGLYLTFEEMSDVLLLVTSLGAILILLAIGLSPRAIAIFVSGRRGRFGLNAALMTLAVFIILLVANYFMFTNPNRIDVTATRFFTLSPQTVSVLKDLEHKNQKVVAHAFFVENTASENTKTTVEDILNEFSRKSENFSYRFVDPEINRSEALNFGVTKYPSVVFSYNDEQNYVVTNFTEQEFITGILISTGKRQKIIYYLTGHGELTSTSDPMFQKQEDYGLDLAIAGMQRDNYFVLPLNLQQFEVVPSDASVVIIAGPDQDLTDIEYEALVNYAKSGGRILMMLNPNPPKLFNDLIYLYGVVVTPQKVADAISNVGGETLTPLLQKANAQFATSAVHQNINIADDISVAFFPDTAALQTPPPEEFALRDHIKFSELASTTPISWLVAPGEDSEYNVEKYTGQYTISGVIEATGTFEDLGSTQDLFKLVVFGDSDFASNKYFYSNDNGDIFLNSVNWLAEDYELISIRPKLVPYREFVVNSLEKEFVKWSSWVFPPLIMILMASIVWWRRR